MSLKSTREIKGEYQLNGLLTNCVNLGESMGIKGNKQAKKSQPEEGLAKDKICLVDM
ncbi:hypothetical protein VCRA2114E365_200068 [Vibrio crassostreae]|nr:hypothetical protein VCRA2119O47_100071 [Vibrio crassostreae]CAK1701779.1 hypothetical protein VCRA2119O44_100093 [Vibrio crassostreae]CAK1782290.1 hypothetical protein VCRA2112O187_1430007 [Vibrio crassostreae]CAK1787181.1 hypothetical protein VCRA2113O351_160069 [Vibrio crassostreae]CAK1793851.1 hypothetical protein VCRA2117O378_170011 [Vibrio crassostreae]